MARSTLDVILNFVTKGDKNATKALKTQLSVMAALGTAAAVARKAWDFAEQGAQLAKFEKAARSMAQSVGQDMSSIVVSLQDVSQGAIDQATAMGLASRAIRLGVAETPEQFAKLGEAAIKLGAAMGRGPVDAMNDIVTGIGRMSPLILDNIGIMTNGGQVFEDYAESIGKAAAELTDAEKKQALFNAAVDDAAPLADVNATGFEQLETSIKDLADVMKKRLVPILEPVAQYLADQIQETNELARAEDELHASGVDSIQLLAMQHAGLVDLGLESTTYRGKVIELTESIKEQGAAEAAVFQGKIYLWEQAKSAAEDAAEDAAEATEEFLMVGAGQEAGAIPAFDSIISKLRTIQNRATLAYAAQKKVVFGPGGPAIQQTRGFETSPDLGPGGQHGFSMTVPPGFGGDGFPFRASSGEQVKVSNRDERSFFSNSNVNINNGTGLEAFEEILRSIQ